MMTRDSPHVSKCDHMSAKRTAEEQKVNIYLALTITETLIQY